MVETAGYLVMQGGEQIAARHGLTFGRAPQCDVVLEDVKASRRHARLIVEGSVVELEDLGSSNGTFLNAHRVKRRLLRDGDEIRIGKTTIAFVEAAPSAPPRTVAATVTDDPYQPGGGLEGDPLPSPPRVEPEQEIEPDEVEILEFVDEVVEVKRAPARAPSPAASPAASPSPRTARAATVGRREQGVLQFSKRPATRGLLGDDLRQMSAAQRALLIVVALAAAVGLVYLIIALVSGG